jgi:hypothetical protein
MLLPVNLSICLFNLKVGEAGCGLCVDVQAGASVLLPVIPLSASSTPRRERKAVGSVWMFKPALSVLLPVNPSV